MTASEIKKIREAAKAILAAKGDAEMTEEDKRVLAQYMGAGGVETREASLDSTIFSDFYTPRSVVEAVWRLADGYAPGARRVLEPSAGIGRFAENRSGQNFTLCEIDPESARIAKILHPDADVKNTAFQQLFVDGRIVKKGWDGEKFDLAVGNPPYRQNDGVWKGLGEGAKHGRMEEYFIDRSLDCLKDGGILAFVMPSAFLRNGASNGKREIALKGKLIDAWRLPNGAFDTTRVGCDIVVIKKERGDVADYCNDAFFARNRHKILGVEVERMNNHWHKTQMECDLPPGKSLVDVLGQIRPLPEARASARTEAKPSKSRRDFMDRQPTLFDGIENEPAKKASAPPTQTQQAEKPRTEQKSAAKAETPKTKESVAPQKMDAGQFLAHYGRKFDAREMEAFKAMDRSGEVHSDGLSAATLDFLHSSHDFVRVSQDGQRESWQHKAFFLSGNIAQKLDDLQGRVSDDAYALLRSVLPKPKTIEEIEIDPKERFAERVMLQDPLYVAEREAYGDGPAWERDSRPKSLRELFFEWADGTPAARAAGLTGTIAAIDGFSPLGLRDFAKSVGIGDVREYIEGVPVRARSWSGISDEDKAEAAKQANEKRENRKQTAIRLFNRFLREGLSGESVKKIESEYNRAYNSFVQADWSKMPLFIDGSVDRYKNDDFHLSEQQWKGVSFLCHKGNGLLAYDVGVGKTAAGIFAAVSQMQTGRAKRPLVMVPKSVLPKWISDIKAMFPDVKVNNLGNMSRAYTAKFSDGERGLNIDEGSISVCTYQATEKMSFSDEALDDELLQDMMDARTALGEEATNSERQQEMERIKTLLGAAARVKGADFVLFDKSGFDQIVVDEAHNFKNLVSSVRAEKTARGGQASQEFPGVSGGKASARAQKLFAMTQIVQRRNDGRNVFLLTATPFVNSPLEIYSMMSYIARDEMRKRDIYNVTQFMQRYADFRYEYSVTPKGQIESKQVMKSFKRLGEMQNLITTYMDKVDGEEAGVIRPRKFTRTPRMRMTELQQKILDVEEARMDGAFKEVGSKGDAAYLVAINNMRTAMLSPALLPHLPEYEDAGIEIPPLENVVECSPKLKFVCDTLIKNWKERSDAGQFVYVPQGVEGFASIKGYLVKNGVPPSAIECVTGGVSSDKKVEVAEKFNDRSHPLKILFGTATLAEGVDLNGNTIAVFNTMLGWNPSECAQVEGRVWRQGNEQGHVHAIYPLIEDSIDSLLYQKHDEKSSRINTLWSYKGDKLNVEDIKPEDLKFDLLRDPAKRARFIVQQKKSEAMQSASRIDMETRELETLVDRIDRAADEFGDNKADYEAELDGGYKRATERYDEAKLLFSQEKIGKEEFERAESGFKYEKEWVKELKKAVDKSQAQIDAIEKKFKSLGLDGKNAALARISEMRDERLQVNKKINEIDATYPEVLGGEIQKNIEREKSMPTLSPEELAEQVSAAMMSNLRPMSEVEAEIKAERAAKRAADNAEPSNETVDIAANPHTAPPEVEKERNMESTPQPSDADIRFDGEPFNPNGKDWIEKFGLQNVPDDENRPLVNDFLRFSSNLYDEIYDENFMQSVMPDDMAFIDYSLGLFTKQDGFPHDGRGNPAIDNPFFDGLQDGDIDSGLLEDKIREAVNFQHDERQKTARIAEIDAQIVANATSEASHYSQSSLEKFRERVRLLTKKDILNGKGREEILQGFRDTLSELERDARSASSWENDRREWDSEAKKLIELEISRVQGLENLADYLQAAENQFAAHQTDASEKQAAESTQTEQDRPAFDEITENWIWNGEPYVPMADGEAEEMLKSMSDIDVGAVLKAMDEADLGFFAANIDGDPCRIDLNRDDDFVVPVTKELVDDIIETARTYYEEGIVGEPSDDRDVEGNEHCRKMLALLGGRAISADVGQRLEWSDERHAWKCGDEYLREATLEEEKSIFARFSDIDAQKLDEIMDYFNMCVVGVSESGEPYAMRFESGGGFAAPLTQEFFDNDIIGTARRLCELEIDGSDDAEHSAKIRAMMAVLDDGGRIEDGAERAAKEAELDDREQSALARAESEKENAKKQAEIDAEMFDAIYNYDYESVALAIENGASLTTIDEGSGLTVLNNVAYDFDSIGKPKLDRILAAAPPDELSEVLDEHIGMNIDDRLHEIQGEDGVAEAYENIKGFFMAACDKAGVDFSTLGWPALPNEFSRGGETASQSAAAHSESIAAENASRSASGETNSSETTLTPTTAEDRLAIFSEIAETLKNDSTMYLTNPSLGEVIFSAGTFGDLRREKGGYGMKHIVQRRFEKDGLDDREISALLYLIQDAVKSQGNINHETATRCSIEKNGIRVAIAKNWFGADENWVVTGYGINGANNKMKREAQDAIATVSANCSYALERSAIREQVGAVIASVKRIRENLKNVNANSQEFSPPSASKSERLESATKGETHESVAPPFKIVQNNDDRRVLLVFGEKPDNNVLEALRQSGWHWSPKNRAWQRQMTKDAIESANALLKRFSAESQAPSEKSVPKPRSLETYKVDLSPQEEADLKAQGFRPNLYARKIHDDEAASLSDENRHEIKVVVEVQLGGKAVAMTAAQAARTIDYYAKKNGENSAAIFQKFDGPDEERLESNVNFVAERQKIDALLNMANIEKSILIASRAIKREFCLENGIELAPRAEIEPKMARGQADRRDEGATR